MISECEFVVDVMETDVMAFAELSGDFNPLHISSAYAENTEFGGRIVHGALLMSYASRVLGMYIPGRESLILAVRAQFPQPVRYPAQLKVMGTLQHWSEAAGLGRVHVTVEIEGTSIVALDALIDFSLHANGVKEEAFPDEGSDPIASKTLKNSIVGDYELRPRLLVTGGTGGLGFEVVEHLKSRYDLVCITRKSLNSTSPAEIEYLTLDLESPACLEQSLNNLDPSRFHSILHMSSARLSQGFASDDLDSVRAQLRHTVEVPLILTQWARSSGSKVKRVVLVGSQTGTRIPQAKLGAYSIAKAAMEHLPILLAADLAGQSATVNVIALGATAVGMNANLSARSIASLNSKSATGKISTPKDLSNLIEFLLSDASSQINGTVIPLDGGVMR